MAVKGFREGPVAPTGPTGSPGEGSTSRPGPVRRPGSQVPLEAPANDLVNSKSLLRTRGLAIR